MGRKRTLRKWAADIAPRERPRRQTPEGLSHGPEKSLGLPAPRTAASRSRGGESGREKMLCLRRSHRTFLCKRQGSSLYPGEAIRLDPRLPGGWEVSPLGTA